MTFPYEKVFTSGHRTVLFTSRNTKNQGRDYAIFPSEKIHPATVRSLTSRNTHVMFPSEKIHPAQYGLLPPET